MHIYDLRLRRENTERGFCQPAEWTRKGFVSSAHTSKDTRGALFFLSTARARAAVSIRIFSHSRAILIRVSVCTMYAREGQTFVASVYMCMYTRIGHKSPSPFCSDYHACLLLVFSPFSSSSSLGHVSARVGI